MGNTYRTYFSDGFNVDHIGWITGSAAYTRFPNLPGALFRLKASSKNVGSFFIGSSSGTLAFEMAARDDTGWFKVGGDNLNNLFYQNVSGSNERLAFWIQR